MIDPLDDNFSTARRWTIRDDIRQMFVGCIPKDQPQITMTLRWKRDAADTPREIGRYRINLPALVKTGFARISDRGYILRFQRTGNNIEVSKNRSSDPHVIGKLS